MDLLGQALWFLIFLTPFIILPLSLRLIKAGKMARILAGLLFSLFISLILYCLSLAILFRDGMGPV